MAQPTKSIQKAIVVDRNVHEVYSLWGSFDNFPQFMGDVEQVTKTGDRTSHWVARGPAGVKLEWDAETTALEENSRIAWRSTSGIENSGEGRFRPLEDGRTEVMLTMAYHAPGGAIGQMAAGILHDTESRVQEDLRRFKEFAGQTIAH